MMLSKIFKGLYLGPKSLSGTLNLYYWPDDVGDLVWELDERMVWFLNDSFHIEFNRHMSFIQITIKKIAKNSLYHERQIRCELACVDFYSIALSPQFGKNCKNSKNGVFSLINNKTKISKNRKFGWLKKCRVLGSVEWT